MRLFVDFLSKSVVKTGLVAIAALSLAGAASAQNAFTNRSVKLHAGPDRNYPTVSVLGPGAAVYVHGCLRNFYWCDVSSGPLRGWANARYLNYTYGGRPLAIYGNGVRFGLPIVGFVRGSYWDNHYRSQPWYNTHRNNWQPNRPYVAPRPPVHHAPAPHFAPAHPPQVHTRPAPVQQHFAPQRQSHPQPVQPHRAAPVQQHQARPAQGHNQPHNRP